VWAVTLSSFYSVGVLLQVYTNMAVSGLCVAAIKDERFDLSGYLDYYDAYPTIVSRTTCIPEADPFFSDARSRPGP
jgi:hypothetical protein